MVKLADPEATYYAATNNLNGQLDSDEPTHWTKSGKPQIDALEAQLGVPVSGALRDVAWSEFGA